MEAWSANTSFGPGWSANTSVAWSSTAPATTSRLWLPRVNGASEPDDDELESASTQLIKGLRGLDTSRSFVSDFNSSIDSLRSSGGRSAMGSVSRYGLRANERAAEVIAEMVDGNSKGSSDTGWGSADIGQNGCAAPIVAAQQAFESIVASIDTALSGGAQACRLVQKEELVNDTVKLHNVRHYKVLLPSRPTNVQVSLTKQSGVPPTLWGSTTSERPNSKNYEYKGKDDKLVYEHALHAEDGEELNQDRRTAVPPCREFFFTVEAEAGECAYALKVHMSNLKIILTKEEISSQVQRMRRGWEARLQELEREPVQREKFEEHLLTLEDEKRERKKEMFRGKDWTMANLEIKDFDRSMKVLSLKKKALERCKRREENTKRKEVADSIQNDAMENWLSRADARAKKRLEQEERKRQEQQLQDAMKSWLVRLGVIVYAEKLKKASLEARNMSRYLTQKAKSASVIYQFFLRQLCWRRRSMLYKNLIRVRLAMVAYVRHVRPAAIHASAPVVQEFLNKHAFNKEAPSLGGALSRFRTKVTKLQRWWVSMRTIRQAYVDMLVPTWLDCQHDFYKAEAERMVLEHDMKDHHGRRGSVQARRGSIHSGSRLTVAPANPERRPSHGRRLSIDAGATKTPEERQHAIERHQDKMPVYVAKIVLYEYVVKMQKSYRKRVLAWELEKEKEEFKHDLEAFGVHEAGEEGEEEDNGQAPAPTALPKPRVVYCDRAEMEALVRDSMYEWKAKPDHPGKWKEIRFNHLRLQRGPFRAWAKKPTTSERAKKRQSTMAST